MKTIKKGFSLVEVTIAMVLVSVVLLALLAGFGNANRNIFNLRAFAVDSYDSQKAMEEMIYEAKDTGTVGVLTTKNIFGRSVDGYLIEDTFAHNASKKYSAFVVPGKSSAINLPTVDSITNEGLPYIYLGEQTGPIKHSFTGSTSYLSSWAFQWCVANRYEVDSSGVQNHFSTPLMYDYYDGVHEDENPMPQFPIDYSGIDKYNTKITATADLLGKHIVYKIQPIGLFGVAGDAKASDPVYVMGVPVLTNLLVHYDPNFLKNGDYAYKLGESFNLTRLYDMYHRGNNTAVQVADGFATGSVDGKKDSLTYNGGIAQRTQQFYNFNDAYIDLPSTGANYTVYLNFQVNSSAPTGVLLEQTSIIGTNNFVLKITPDRKLQLICDGEDAATGTPYTNLVVYESAPLSTSASGQPLHTIALSIKPNSVRLRLDSSEMTFADGVPATFLPQIVNADKRLGGAGHVEIAELLLYNLNYDASVEKFLYDKTKFIVE